MPSRDDFFAKPKTWSKLKYKILNLYFREYFHKVNHYYKEAALVADLFAGNGKFEDGSDGSPLILCQYARAARRSLGYKNTVYVAETLIRNRIALKNNLKEYLEDGTAKFLEGDARQAGSELLDKISTETPFVIFQDPFGLKGLSMDLLRKIFSRVELQSTEVLINYNEPSLRRHFGRIKKGRDTRDAKMSRKILEELLGSASDLETVIEVLNDPRCSLDKAVQMFTEMYISEFRKYFKYTGAFPVTETYGSEKLKYYLIFATRSLVAFELMSNSMASAYENLRMELSRILLPGSLFEGMPADGPLLVTSARETLGTVVIQECKQLMAENSMSPSFSRGKIIRRCVNKHFGHYTNAQFNKEFKTLIELKKICTLSGDDKINDDTPLKFIS